jgi:beta-phosphoglucomutase-like phosphatase (HAD superfamily)
MIRAFLFDMDGVLVDSMKAHFYAFNSTIMKFSKESISLKTFNEKFWGRYIADNVKEIFGNIPGKKLREIVEEYPIQVGEYAEHMKLYEDAERVLEELKKEGLKLGLITSSQEEIVEPLIMRLRLKNYFDVIVCGDQIERPKPHPTASSRHAAP